MNPFQALGVAKMATKTEVRQAYYRLARSYHPDKAGPDSTAKFQVIQGAYEAIMTANWNCPRESEPKSNQKSSPPTSSETPEPKSDQKSSPPTSSETPEPPKWPEWPEPPKWPEPPEKGSEDDTGDGLADDIQMTFSYINAYEQFCASRESHHPTPDNMWAGSRRFKKRKYPYKASTSSQTKFKSAHCADAQDDWDADWSGFAK